ncbi:MAG TPA: sensor histidine kinase [Burkholderiaceae bacterium]|nr:sensor histidine kinase [Burkholderiaceae bacterium]
MRLSEFIRSDMEGILADWQAFAATQLPGAAGMKPLELRDHAQKILEAVAKDINQPQTEHEQAEKSKGQTQPLINAAETAAETHAVLRARDGFDIAQMTAEYRALRASVLRRWVIACEPVHTDLQDMIRFNEAIDQAIAESVRAFSTQVEQARNFFLGMLGHDMRSPLSAILLSASSISKLNASDHITDAAKRIMNSGNRMRALLEDLVDFNRTKLGVGIRITPSDVDLRELFESGLQQLRVTNPAREILLTVSGDMRGHWDGNRLQQLLDNLVINAIKYGDVDAPVGVTLSGNAEDVVLAVSNRGPAIELGLRQQIFDPLMRGPSPFNPTQDGDGLGLGLFISREITNAHGGSIEVDSDANETVFTVRLPRRVKPNHENQLDRHKDRESVRAAQGEESALSASDHIR